MKYVLKAEARSFLRSVISDHFRYEEICRKAEAVFNAEQDRCSFEIARLHEDGFNNSYLDSYAEVTLRRESMCAEIKELWELTDEEINGINDSEKAAA